jgi:hypothetical protein
VSQLVGFFGVGDMVGGAADLQNGEAIFVHATTGMSWSALQSASPGTADLIELKFRTEGASLATLAILGIAVCLTGFRRRERWAWFALWALPVWMLSTVLFILGAARQPGYGTPVPVISGSILCVIWASVLAMTNRRFFRS